MENNTHHNDLSGKLYHHTVSPSDAVWNRIQAQLDADLAAFDTGNKQRFWWYGGSLLAVAAIVFLTWNHYNTLHMAAYEPVATGSQMAIQKSTYSADIQNFSSDLLDDQLNASAVADIASQSSRPHTAVRHETAESPSAVSSGSAHLAAANGSTSEQTANQESATVALSDDDLLTADEPVAAISDSELAESLTPEEQEALEQAAAEKEAELAALIAEDEASDAEIEPVEKPKKPAHSPFEGFYIGASGGWHASTMLTGQEVVINDNPIQTGVRFGPSKGLTLGYVFGPNLSLQAEYLYNVVEGQNYYMEVEGAVRSKTMSLYFDQIPVTVKLRTPRTIHALKMPASLNIVAGTQLNILKDYQIPRENKLELEGDIYRKTSFSLLAGAEYEVLVTDHIMVSMGLEGSLSENVSTSNDPVGSFPKHSISGGAKGGVYYLFGR